MSSYFKLSVFSLKKKNELNTFVPLKTTDTVCASLASILKSVDDKVIEIIKSGGAARSSKITSLPVG